METPGYDDVENHTLCDGDDQNSLGAHLSTLYYFMFLFSLCGTALVLVIIYRFEKLTTVTNILLLNLVLSSLIFMSSLPFIGVYMQLSHWIFGEAMCKIVCSVYYLGFSSSVLFLTLLTFDRHLAVVYSLEAQRVRNQGYAVISCAVVWLISSLACIKPMMFQNLLQNNMNNQTYCEEWEHDLSDATVNNLKKAEFYIQLILFLIFPLVVIIYCYLRIAITVLSSRIIGKFKTVRLIFIIVLLFFLCWTPFNIVSLMSADTCEQENRKAYALHITRNIAYIYFCFSPILYTFVGKKFQNYFRQIVVKRFPGLKRHISGHQNSSRNTMSTKTTPNYL
ncbi:C-C chemokine receptor type 3-like [Hippoglossus hippoglossus]|uniref:C-C chemokine receptor type 3-like n=1 Tax=Hippoglossus hippoglossus TaxID=8267 RepID=UPI00148BD0AC|nr:C-C chemokine receptor type 3-like [Hippoglossus hippoglossus]